MVSLPLNNSGRGPAHEDAMTRRQMGLLQGTLDIEDGALYAEAVFELLHRYLTVAIALLGVAAVAGSLPAWRAARVEPREALSAD